MQVCCLSAILTLCACTPQVPAKTTIMPEETPTIQTPAPQREENPIEVFWDGFYEAYTPYQATMDKAAGMPNQIRLLDKALTLELHLQRLQQMFLSLTSLRQNGDKSELWDGMFFGAMEGTGSIAGTEDNCTFSCTFSDTSQLRGELKNDKLESVWQSEGWTIRRAQILHADTGWYAWVVWEDTNSLLYIAEDALWFSERLAGISILDMTTLPAEWADWGFQNGSFFESNDSIMDDSNTTKNGDDVF